MAVILSTYISMVLWFDNYVDKIVSKFVAKIIKYMILFKDILTYLGLDYRDALLIIVYLVELVFQKSDA